MKAILKNYRQSPRKVRLVVDVIRGKSVTEALYALQFVEKRAADPVAKVVKSAVANAQAAGLDVAKLKITHVAVDKGETLKRFMPRARGSASRINKRSSHITVTVGTK
jgi:large subunit ribosomal protein L22